MTDIIKCEDCKYVQKWRSPEQAAKFGQIYECKKRILSCPEPDDFCSKAERKEQKFVWRDLEDELKDLSKKVENIENQIKKDKEEQLEKLKAEREYAKFCCALPTI